jgi:DNA-binding NarL/FixJ family response regulator
MHMSTARQSSVFAAAQAASRHINILLVDDQASVRFGLKLRLNLEPDMSVIAEASDGIAALALAEKLAPDVVLMDVHMPLMDGLQAARRIHEALPGSAVVMLSMYDDSESRRVARENGAAEFVCKDGASEPLLAAVRAAAIH